jgi:hypothetical protein
MLNPRNQWKHLSATTANPSPIKKVKKISKRLMRSESMARLKKQGNSRAISKTGRHQTRRRNSEKALARVASNRTLVSVKTRLATRRRNANSCGGRARPSLETSSEMRPEDRSLPLRLKVPLRRSESAYPASTTGRTICECVSAKRPARSRRWQT